MCGLVTFLVDTAAALAKYITEQERGVSCPTTMRQPSHSNATTVTQLCDNCHTTWMAYDKK